MLNGLAPILIFTLKNNPAALSPVFNALNGIPLIGSDVANIVAGIPIPLYLDEKLTGLYVENEARNIDIETTNEQKFDDSTAFQYQRNLNSSVTVNLLATKDSILLPALLALADLLVPKLVSQNYGISYFNGPTLVLNGLLQGLNTSTTSDDDLIRIQLQIQKKHEGKKITPSVLGASSGTVPGVGL